MNPDDTRAAAVIARVSARSATFTAWTSSIALILTIYAIAAVLLGALGRWLA